MVTKFVEGTHEGIPSLYSFHSLMTLRSWFKNLLVFFNFACIVLICNLYSLAISLAGFSAPGCLCLSGILSLASLVDGSCLLPCLILCSMDRASTVVRHMANTITTEVATTSFLGKPVTTNTTNWQVIDNKQCCNLLSTRVIFIIMLSQLLWLIKCKDDSR